MSQRQSGCDSADLVWPKQIIKKRVSCFRYQDILHSIHLTRKSKLGLRTCDGYEELLKYMRSDIQEIASRLQKGGLGYLDKNADIEEEVSPPDAKLACIRELFLFLIFSSCS